MTAAAETTKAHDDEHEIDQHGQHAHDPIGGSTTPFYQAPVQLQRWGDQQMLPHVNWGDLFFDLFYVGAAYNLGNLLRNERTWRGILYFSALFLNVSSIWFDKLVYDARFNVGNDLFHRVVEVAQLAVLATAVVHINSVAEMSDTKENPDMFVFCLCNLLHEVYHVVRELECYFMVKTPEVKPSTKREVFRHFFSTLLLLAATVISATDFYGDQDDDHYDDHDHMLRMMAEEKYDDTGDDAYENDAPVYLVLASWVSMGLMLFLKLGSGVTNETSIPMNVDFVIHRHGEWVMLMLGETVLSLLIVEENHGKVEYYWSFYAGLLTVIILQYLHFKSQPHDPSEHAMRRSKLQGILNMILVQIYSGALVALGASYKMLLYEFQDEVKSPTGHRLMVGVGDERMLAGGTVCGDDEECKNFTAHLYCFAMALVLLTLDLMSLTHKGWKEHVGRCKRKKNPGRFNIRRLLFILLNVLVIVFFTLLADVIQEPHQLARIGLAAVLVQVFLRLLGDKLFPPDPDACQFTRNDGISTLLAAELRMSEKWPNTTYGDAVHVAVPEKSDPPAASPDHIG